MTRHNHCRLEHLDQFFLGLSFCILTFSALRFYGVEQLQKLRAAANEFCFGDLSGQEVLQAFGAWNQSASELQTVFQPIDFTASDDLSAQEIQFDQAMLTAEDTDFPSEPDETRYAIAFSCKAPVEGVISSAFGMRSDPINQESAFHKGIDIAAEEGEPIHSLADGIVREVGENSYGKYAIINHQDGTSALYAHCSAVLVETGQAVTAGEQLAKVGSTGRATGSHLHLELWRAGKLLDPMPYLSL